MEFPPHFLILFLSTFLSIVSCHIFDVDFLSSFPVFEDENFHLKFISNSSKLPERKWIVIRIVDGFSEKQRIEFNPNLAMKSTNPIVGPYFSIMNHAMDQQKDLTSTVRFSRNSQGNKLEIYYIPAKNKVEVSEIFKNQDHHNFQLVAITVNLYLHWTFELVQKINDSNVGGLLDGSKGQIICRATGGSPFTPVEILGLEYLKVISKRYDEETNSEIAEIESRLEDNNKSLFCKSNEEIYFEKLMIFRKICGGIYFRYF